MTQRRFSAASWNCSTRGDSKVSKKPGGTRTQRRRSATRRARTTMVFPSKTSVRIDQHPVEDVNNLNRGIVRSWRFSYTRWCVHRHLHRCRDGLHHPGIRILLVQEQEAKIKSRIGERAHASEEIDVQLRSSKKGVRSFSSFLDGASLIDWSPGRWQLPLKKLHS